MAARRAAGSVDDRHVERAQPRRIADHVDLGDPSVHNLDVSGSKIAMLNDTCGNFIQMTQLMRW
jgi:hypothetical protein